MLEGLADIELLKDIQLILPNMTECVRLSVINKYDYLNGSSPRGRGLVWHFSRMSPGGTDKTREESS